MDSFFGSIANSAKERIVHQNRMNREPATVYFTKDISADSIVRMYKKLMEGKTFYGQTGIKLHTGEPHGPNIIPPDMVKPLQEIIPNSCIVETNTLYDGVRKKTSDHRKTLAVNGWDFCPVDILDEFGGVNLPLDSYFHLPYINVGKNLLRYRHLVVLTHFKGHMMGGYGGSLKNIAIGCASGRIGKAQVHGVPYSQVDSNIDRDKTYKEDEFMERLADSGKGIQDFFHTDGRSILYINVLRRMSVDCDCVGTSAAPVVTPDIGIFGSWDLLAIDKASVDAVLNLPKDQRHDLEERMKSRHGLHQLEAMEKLDMGTSQYKIVSLDDIHKE